MCAAVMSQGTFLAQRCLIREKNESILNIRDELKTKVQDILFSLKIFQQQTHSSTIQCSSWNWLVSNLNVTITMALAVVFSMKAKSLEPYLFEQTVQMRR